MIALRSANITQCTNMEEYKIHIVQQTHFVVNYWKCNFPMSTPVRRSDGWSVDLPKFAQRVGRYISMLLSEHLLLLETNTV